MRRVRIFLSRAWGSLRRTRLDRELEEELRFHLEMEAESNQERGMASADAFLAAQRTFGGAEQLKEIYRDQRGLPMFELLLKDLQYGLRMIRRSPGFTAVAVLSLALGIGANTAIFTLIDAVLLRSLPVASPEQLVTVGDSSRPNGKSVGAPMVTIFSYPLYQRLRRQNTVFTGLMASGTAGPVDITVGDGGPERARYRLVSGNYFEVLGVPAELGRTFTAAEDVEAASPVIVISDDYWTSRFARDPAILGRTMRLNGASFTIAGVGPRGFTGDVVGTPADIWAPISTQAQIHRADARLAKSSVNWLVLMGRLKPGVTLAAARAEINAVTIQSIAELAGSSISADKLREMQQQGVPVGPGAKGFSAVRKRVSAPLLTLMTVVGLVLLVACGNIANLLLARATGRRKEISVRLAVGAGRGRLVRQLLTESLVLAAIGGAAGWLLALWGSNLLLRLASDARAPIPLDVHPNTMVLGFTAGISVLTGVLFGLVPALRATRVDLAPTLREAARGVSGSGRQLGKLLVVGQVALSLLLLIGAGLFIRSLINLETMDVGYSRENLILIRVDLTASGYTQAQQLPLVARLMERLSSIPGVAAVTVSENGIFSGTDSGTDSLKAEGFSSARKEDFECSFDQVGSHFFQVVGVPLLAGRDFDERDRAGVPNVAIVNDTLARFYFGNNDPIGKTLLNGGDRYRIVGVVKNMKERDLKGAPERRFFLPIEQSTDRFAAFNFELRTRQDAAGLISTLRRDLQAFDSNLKVTSLQPATALMDQSISEERLVAQLSGFFGVLALLLAATGLYGVMAYATSRRAGEIGLRMALGASRGSVIRMVLRETLVLVLGGIAIGLPTALAATRLVATSLVGLSVSDPSTLVAATVVMLIAALLAGLLPAARAAHIDPMAALRQD